MGRVPRRAALALLAAPVLPVRLLAAPAPIFPPGSAIGMALPPGMSLSERFAGFSDAAADASIVLMEMAEGAYKDLDAPGRAVPFEHNGFVVTVRRDMLAGNLPAVLLRGTQAHEGTEYAKWMLIARPPSFAAFVTAQVPSWAAKRHTAADVEAALETLAIRIPADTGVPLASLLFTMDSFAGFHLVGAHARTVMGSLAVFTEGPLDNDPDRQQPEMLALWHRQPFSFPPKEWDDRARMGLLYFQPYDLERGQTERLSLPSGEWLVLEGTGHAGEHLIYVFQATLFAAAGFLLIMGSCRNEMRAAMAPRFREAALSARLL